MRLLLLASTGLLAVLAFAALGAEPAALSDDAVTLKTVKYSDLVRTVRDLQGKVVVVDFWGEFCIPCKKEFPHLVELQHKYSRDDFAAVSVSVDGAGDKDATDRALKFLRTQGADFTNLLLDEQPEVWSEKLSADAPPFIFVFDRNGRIAGKFQGKDANYQDKVGPMVVHLLNK